MVRIDYLSIFRVKNEVSVAKIVSIILSIFRVKTIDYSTSPRNGNRVNGNHLDICLSFSQKNGNSLTWVLVALTVCFTCPVPYRVSAESRAGEWEL